MERRKTTRQQLEYFTRAVARTAGQIFIISWPVKILWNWKAVDLFAVPELSVLDTASLLVLLRLVWVAATPLDAKNHEK